MSSTSTSNAGLLGRIGGIAFRNRGKVALAWVAAFVVVFAISVAGGGKFSADYTAPGSDSTQAKDLLEHRFPAQAVQQTLTVIAHSDTSITATRGRLDALLAQVAAVPHVAAVHPPWHEPGGISPDGRTVRVQVDLDVATPDLMPIANTEKVLALAKATSHDGLTVAVGGDAVGITESAPIGSELLGIGAAAVILLLMFGTVIAAGLPLLIAIIGIAVSALLTVAISAVVGVPDWSTSLVAMMVIGLGIDYTLLMVTRFREWRSHGLDAEAATVATMDTAGRSVVLAGTTVVISMLGLFAMGLSFMRGAAIVTIGGVLVILTAAMTLFPALLGYLGKRIDKLRIPLPRRRASAGRDGWVRWSSWVQRHRYVSAAVGVLVMLALATPFLGVRFGSVDAGNDPIGTSTRTAHDLTAAAFGPGANGPLVVVLDHPTTASVARVTEALRHAPGVASVQPPVTNPAGNTTVVQVLSKDAQQDEGTARLVHRLRDHVLPAVVAGTATKAHVGGETAAVIDSDSNTTKRIPLLLAGVVGLSLLLLLVAFRSVAIALQAAVMNLLSVAASYGVVAFALQGGWFGQLVGVHGKTPLPAFVPVLMFAILFSLSADYEIFLISRMRDAYKATGDTGHAVRTGLASTARVITAAAAIMIAVFAAFIPSPDVTVKMIGVGMVAAILLDATIVRLLLVPSVMHILGERNWWIPRWLDRRLPTLAVDGHEEKYLPTQAPERELLPV